jgi:hypothetical protein
LYAPGTNNVALADEGAVSATLYVAADRLRPVLRRTAPIVLAVLAAVTAATAGASAAAPSAAAPQPSVPTCALGTSAADLRGFYAAALARAERRVPKAQRRQFAAAVAQYVYGVGPVSVAGTVTRFPQNQLVSIAKLVDPSVRTVVLPNHDTTYTVGQLQLASGPLVLDVPDTAGRYYVIQLLDAYSNTFAYVGRRTTGTRAGSYAIVPPGFRGSLPSGAKKIQSPTNLVWVLGRTLIKTDAELPKVADLMGGYRVTPLASWTTGTRQSSLVLPGFPASPPIPLPTGAAYFTKLTQVLKSDPPPARDACALRAFRKAGGDLSAAERAGTRIVNQAEQRANRYSARRNNGWLLPGPYVGNYGRNYLGRAVIALNALGANTRPETIYPIALDDAKGRPLSGGHRYTIRFPRGQLPPADAFWSLTIYDKDRYLVPNPIDRYAIGDRTPGLHRGRDGSLTIYVQHAAPAGAKRANWLPAPAGRFRLALRIYEPRRSALSGRWKPPPVQRPR